MPDQPSILAAVRSMTAKGQQLLGDRWMAFFYTLRSHLQEEAQELEESADELLLFRFPDPAQAINGFFKRIDQTKREFQWREDLGPAPVQFLLHLDSEPERPQPFRDPATSLWEIFAPEIPYATPALAAKWQELTREAMLPSHHLQVDESGFSAIKFPGRSAVSREPLFPHRLLPLAGPEKPCFYCGMTRHQPTNCPSKLLSMQTQGLPLIGYTPLPMLSDIYREVFENEEPMLNLLAAGVTPSQIRKDVKLATYIAYFDILKIYQPRFLWNLAFTVHTQWHELGRPETVTVDSHNLHLGLDCLRVGQYAQAEDLFVDESRRPKGKQFYATIGRAFISLEMGREHDMGHFLESALRMTTTDKDRIYISMLLSRYYELLGDTWKSEHALDNVFSIDRNCAEALYRQLQLSVNTGFGDRALRQLRSLVVGEKELFMQALIDPQLAPIAPQVEDILLARLNAQEKDAEEHLAKARAICHELASWFAEDQEEVTGLLKDLGELEEQFQHKSYYDMIDVAERSRILLHACYRLQENELDKLKARVDDTIRRWEGYRRFWESYPYPMFFKGFGELLDQTRATLSSVKNDSQRNMHADLFRSLNEALDNLEESFERMKGLAVRMGWVKVLLDGVKLFAKRLVITEIVLVLLGFLIVPSLALLLGDSHLAGFVELLTDPYVQKQLLLITTLFLAPLIALGHTLWTIMEE